MFIDEDGYRFNSPLRMEPDSKESSEEHSDYGEEMRRPPRVEAEPQRERRRDRAPRRRDQESGGMSRSFDDRPPRVSRDSRDAGPWREGANNEPRHRDGQDRRRRTDRILEVGVNCD